MWKSTVLSSRCENTEAPSVAAHFHLLTTLSPWMKQKWLLCFLAVCCFKEPNSDLFISEEMETSQWWQIYWLNGHHKKIFMQYRLALTTLWELIGRGDVHSRNPVLFNPLYCNLYIYIAPFTQFPRALYKNVITTVLKNIQVYWWPTFRLENTAKGARLLSISWQWVSQWQARKKMGVRSLPIKSQDRREILISGEKIHNMSIHSNS